MYTLSIEKGSSLPARESDQILFQCFIMLFIMLMYINMIHLSTFCYTRSRPDGILLQLGCDHILRTGGLSLLACGPWSRLLHLVSGTLAKEVSRVYSFWHAGQGVLSC